MFLDTANTEEIRECFRSGVFKGVTTNPTILLKEGVERFEQIQSILETEAQIIYVQILGATAEALYADYERLKQIKTGKKIGIKVPINTVGLEVVKKIKADNEDSLVLGTAIYSAEQGILAALAGCDCVAPYVNRMSRNNIDPFEAIARMRSFFDDRKLNCEILAASFKNTKQILDALRAGAHTCTISADLFRQMANKELAMNTITVFNEDGMKLEEKTT